MPEVKPKDTVFISGGTKGLGRALSLQFGGSGYRVISLFHADDGAAQSLRQEFKKRSIEGLLQKVDITQVHPSDWGTEIEAAIQQGSLTLINNAAAHFHPKPLHRFQWDEFEENFMVAVKGSFYCCQAVIQQMARAKQGTIINVLSSAIEKAPPKGFSAYVVAKFGLLGLTKSLASEYHRLGIRVFSVSPSFMETEMTGAWDPHTKNSVMGSLSPQDPQVVASKIFQYAQRSDLPGKGENYPLSE